jgi:hypothetical protein
MENEISLYEQLSWNTRPRLLPFILQCVSSQKWNGRTFRSIADPDRRVGSRIEALNENEQGFLHVKNMTQRRKTLSSHGGRELFLLFLQATIEAWQSTTFELDFNGQVPVQIRRSGRNNGEGVALPWRNGIPNGAEFDKDGWNASPYIGREFHGVWGDFDVKLTR